MSQQEPSGAESPPAGSRYHKEEKVTKSLTLPEPTLAKIRALFPHAIDDADAIRSALQLGIEVKDARSYSIERDDSEE